MSQLILINGNPGVGKTSFLDVIKQNYPTYICISKDEFKEGFLNNLIPDKLENKSQLAGSLAMRFGFQFAQEMLCHNQNVFFEANFHPEYSLVGINKLKEFKLKQIYLYCSDQTAFERFQSRLQNNTRHAIHTQADSQILSVEQYIQRHKKDQIQGLNTLRVSTEQPYQIQEILDFIDN